MGREATHDVTRSDALTSGQLQSLRALHEGLPQVFAAALSTVLRSHAEVHLAGIDQFAYGKFVYALEDPSHFNVLKAEPLGDRVMLDVELAILYPMLDRLLGGGHADEPPPRRPPSDIEVPLAARLVRMFLEHLRQAWQGVLPLRFEVLQTESHPRLLRVLPSDESVAVLSFAISIGAQHGAMRLCFPCRAIHKIDDKLRPSPAVGLEDAATTDAAGGAEVVVTLATSTIAADDLRGLRVGDIIATETAADAPAVVSIDGEPRFLAKPVEYEGRKAAVLSAPISEPPR
jgi:flagellar motor switch protein FliM